MNIKTVQGRHSELLNINGVHVGQTPKTLECFNQILTGFKNIIEIGTHKGGMTLLLRELMDSDANITTFDTNESRISDVVKTDDKIKIIISDCFKCTNTIKELIQQEATRRKKYIIV